MLLLRSCCRPRCAIEGFAVAAQRNGCVSPLRRFRPYDGAIELTRLRSRSGRGLPTVDGKDGQITYRVHLAQKVAIRFQLIFFPRDQILVK